MAHLSDSEKLNALTLAKPLQELSELINHFPSELEIGIIIQSDGDARITLEDNRGEPIPIEEIIPKLIGGLEFFSVVSY